MNLLDKKVKRAREVYGKIFLSAYPEKFKRRFGLEMEQVFEELYRESEKNHQSKMVFWLGTFKDTLESSFKENLDEGLKINMKKFFKANLSIYNIVGIALLLPIFLVAGIDVLSRIVQGDLIHYNRPFYALLSHTPLYAYPVLITWVLYFPILAIALNILSLTLNASKFKGDLISSEFTKANLISLSILGLGVLFILEVFFHDIAPCVVNGTLHSGLGNFVNILNYCRLNA